MTLPAARIDWNHADASILRPGEEPLELPGVRLLVVRNVRTRAWEARLFGPVLVAEMAVEDASANRTRASLTGPGGERWEVRNLGCGCGG